MESNKNYQLRERPQNELEVKREIIELYTKFSSFFLAPTYDKNIFIEFLQKNPDLEKLNEEAYKILFKQTIAKSKKLLIPASIFNLSSSQPLLQNSLNSYLNAIAQLHKEGDANALLGFFDRAPEFFNFIKTNAKNLEHHANKFNQENPELLQDIKSRTVVNNQYLESVMEEGFSDLLLEAFKKYIKMKKPEISEEEMKTKTSEEEMEIYSKINIEDIEKHLAPKDYCMKDNDFIALIEKITIMEIDQIDQKNNQENQNKVETDKHSAKKLKKVDGAAKTIHSKEEEDDDELRRKHRKT